MPTLTKILERSGRLNAGERERLHLLIGDWSTIADISFSDLLLYVETSAGYVIGAHSRPATAATIIEADIVGDRAARIDSHNIEQACRDKNIFRQNRDGVLHTYIPVVYKGSIIAVMQVVTAEVPDRVPSQRHENYEEISQTLFHMVASGEFPFSDVPLGVRRGAPRVSDGVIHLDSEGVVIYASPNSVSHFRRLGEEKPLAGQVLAEVVTGHLEEYAVPDESLPLVLTGKAAWNSEITTHGVTVSVRSVPLLENGKRLGAIVMSRDVTELRRQEQQLLSKDATIREINHRVKNNLQTVSALLRLQGRRASNAEIREALGQAQRRVEMIALVHEGLSQTVDEVVEFDSVFGSLLRMVRDIAVTSNNDVSIDFTGSFGKVRAEQATALAMVLNEIISNAVEHGLSAGGEIQVRAARTDNLLHLEVQDNGVGIGDKMPGDGLGTKIVKTLVNHELDGRISWENAPEGGTLVKTTMRLR